MPYKAGKATTRLQLAREMVRHARQLGMRFSWVGVDSLYGNDPALLRALADDEEVFVADVHKNQHICLADPQPRIPSSPFGKERKRKRPVAQSEPVRVKEWLRTQPTSAWPRLTLRENTRGKLQVEVMHRRVWVWDGKETKARHRHLIVRREVKSPEKLTYSLTNPPEPNSLERLAQMHGQRWWVECSFSGYQESGRSGLLSKPRVESLAPSHGSADDGDPLHAQGANRTSGRLPVAESRRYRNPVGALLTETGCRC